MPIGGPASAGDDATAVDERKRVLRSRMRAVARVLAARPDVRARRSAAVCDALVAAVEPRLAALDRPGRVMVFEPWRTELDIGPFARWCRSAGHEVFAPRLAGDTLHVEPGDVDPGRLDVVVVPGLAFTPGGGRLGRGGGHYDRLLARLSPGCLTVGVAAAEQIVERLPLAEHDRPVDRVIWGT